MFGRFDACFGFVAVFAAIVSLSLFRRFTKAARPTAELRKVGVPAVGTVTDNDMRTRTQSSTSSGRRGPVAVTSSSSWVVYWPILRFRTQSGEEITAVGKNPARKSFAVGTEVPVIYDPKRPANVMIKGGPDGRSTVGLAISAIVAVAAIGVLIALAVGVVQASDPANAHCPDGTTSLACR